MIKLKIENWKYIVATLAPLIIISISLLLAFEKIRGDIDFSKKELDGVHDIHLLNDVLLNIQSIRGLTNIIMLGSAPADIEKKIALLQQHTEKTLNEWLADKHSIQFKTNKYLEKINANIRDVFAKELDNSTSTEIFNTYTSIIKDLLKLNLIIANNSNLILDPEPISYYLISLIAILVPDLTEAVGQLRGTISGLLAKQELTEKNVLSVRHKIEHLRHDFERLKNRNDVASETLEGVEYLIKPLYDNLERAIAIYLSDASQILEWQEKPDAIDFFNKSTAVIEVSSRLKVKAHVNLVMLIEERIRGLQNILLYIITGTSLAMLTMTFFIVIFYRDNKKMLLSLTDKNLELFQAKEIMDLELEIARKTQEAMLPSKEQLSAFSHCQVEAYYKAATSIGGDFYNLFEYGDNKVAFLMADVSGHGPAAALIVSALKMIVENERRRYLSPVQFVKVLNEKLISVIPEDSFSTLFFGVADFTIHRMIFVCAGHPAPFLFGERKTEPEALEPPSMPIGMFEDAIFNEGSIDFCPRDKLLFFSDGLFETKGASGEIYGMGRFKSKVNGLRQASPSEVINGLLDDVENYWDGESELDDIAIVVVKFI